MIVEFGCYDGRALEVARFAGTRYLGVDMEEHAISTLRDRIKQEGLQDLANAIVGNALEHQKWGKAVVSPRQLHLLPFNLLGNFPRCPQTVAFTGAGRGNNGTLRVQLQRAGNQDSSHLLPCGVRDLRQVDSDRGGVLFTGDGDFYSEAFSEDGLRTLAESSRATVLRTASNGIGHCATVLLGEDY